MLERRAAELGIPVTRTRASGRCATWRSTRAAAASPPRAVALRIDCPLAGRAPGGERADRRRGAGRARDSGAGAIERGHRRGALAGPPGARRRTRPRSFSTAPTIPPARAPWPPTSTGSTPDRRVWLIYGAMRDKAIPEVGGILFPARSPRDRDRPRAGPRRAPRNLARNRGPSRHPRRAATSPRRLRAVRARPRPRT